MVDYLLRKNKHWTTEIFDKLEWTSMGSSLRKMKDIEVTNVIKLVHGWQHHGYQKALFFDDDE